MSKNLRQNGNIFISNAAFADSEVLQLPIEVGQQPFWHLYTLQIAWGRLNKDKVAFFRHAENNGIGVQVHYIPLHCQPIAQKMIVEQAMTGAEGFYHGVVSLPCFPDLSLSDQQRVIDMVRDFVID